jgi:hypothetical protein
MGGQMALTSQQLKIAGAIAGIIVCVLLFRSFLAAHDLRVKTDAAVAQQQAIATANAAAEKKLADTIDARDKAAQSQIDNLNAAIAKIKTPQAIVQYVAKDLAPTAQLPITAVIPAATAANPLPDAIITVPQADLPILRDRLASCDTNAIALATCQKDSTDKAQQLKDAGAALSAMTNERDSYKTELAGGTKWTRIKKATKFLAVGAAVGVAAVCGSGHCK